MTSQRETYRDRSGRFASRSALWQGPIIPANHPLSIKLRRDAIAAALFAPNALYNLFVKGRTK